MFWRSVEIEDKDELFRVFMLKNLLGSRFLLKTEIKKKVHNFYLQLNNISDFWEKEIHENV